MREITSKERVLAAVGHRTTDRVPITFDAEKEVYDLLHAHFGTASREQLFDRLRVDTWMILPQNFIYTEGESRKQEKTALWGYRTRPVSYGAGSYEELTLSPLAGRDEIADIRAHPWPGEEALGFSHFPAEAEAHRDRAVIGVFTWGAFHIASLVRGMNDLMVDFGLQSRYLDHLLGEITERIHGYLDRLLDAGQGVDIVYMCDDYCSQRAPLFSPALFKKYVVPYLSGAVDKVHRRGKKFLLHVCGAVRPLLPMIVDAGVDILEPIQVRAEGMEPQALKKEFGGHICFYGGLDLQEVLCRQSAAEVAAETRRLIEVLGENGGYILGPGHTYIQVDAPLENILAMYETAAAHRPRRGG